MTDTRTLGQVLHEARKALGEQRPRGWPVEDWADRDSRLQAGDEAMAAAVETVVRERIAAVLRDLAYSAAAQPVVVPGIERRTRRDTYLAAAQVVLHGGQVQECSDEKGPQP